MNTRRMDITLETKLNQQSTFNYESFSGASQFMDGSSSGVFSCGLNKTPDISHFPKEIPLKQLASGSPDLLDGSLSELKESDENLSSQDTLMPLYAASVIFALGVTIALILHNYLGESVVSVKGVLVSDHEDCTALGQRVLHDRGSSVDAAIVAALCLGVVHPHVSGVGGGGVMLVHDIHKNETRVINFQGAAPKALKANMLQNASELKAGLYVGVPGMLRGLHRAHSLYGSLSWEDVITRVAALAKKGFNVSFSLAEAISKVKREQLSQRFRDLFLPGGRALQPGAFLRMPGLAGVLEADLSSFYDGDFSQEIEHEVRANGGVLSRDDISNYSAQVQQPVEGLFGEFIIQVPPPPSVGAALISAIKVLEAFHITESNNTDNQTHRWIVEALKRALAMASGLGDPKYNSSLTELLSDMLSKSQAEVIRQRTSDLTDNSSQTHLTAGEAVVMGPDDLMVSVSSSLCGPFGSRIITRSGVILNSLILDFSWPDETRGQLSVNQRNRGQRGKAPVSFLMPTIVVPAWHKCGIRAALSSSGGLKSLAQVLIDVLSLHKEKNDSLSLKRLPPQLQSNRLFVGSEFPEGSVQFLHEKDHNVQTVKTNSAVQGIVRNKDTIGAIKHTQLPDS